MRARKSERTAEILQALLKKDGTAEAIANRLKVSRGLASMTLLRLFQYKQVERTKVKAGVIVVDKDEGTERPKYVFIYAITAAGEDRLKRFLQK